MLGDFSFSIPLCFFFSSVCSSLSLSSCQSFTTCSSLSPFPSLFVLLLFLVSHPGSVVSPSVRGGMLSPDKGSVFFFYALVCCLVSRHRQIHGQTDRLTTCSSMHLCPSTWRLRCTTCQPAVFLREAKVNE